MLLFEDFFFFAIQNGRDHVDNAKKMFVLLKENT